jgi:hypothetical protein
MNLFCYFPLNYDDYREEKLMDSTYIYSTLNHV